MGPEQATVGIVPKWYDIRALPDLPQEAYEAPMESNMEHQSCRNQGTLARH